MRNPEYEHWRSAHRGKRRGQPGRLKVRHRTPWGAWWHWLQVSRKYGPQEYNVYACHWRDDFRQGRSRFPHWHVGTNYRYGVRP